MHDIITIGAGTRDVFLISDQFTFIQSTVFENGVGECVSLGSKIELDSIVHSTGGGATNAATTFARLGLKTSVICRVGDDGSGRDLLIDLQREGIGTTLVRRVEGGVTGYSTLLTTKSGERTVLVYRGVSGEFTAKDIPFGDCETRWMYMTSLGGNVALAKQIIAYAKQCGTQVAWNVGRKEIAKGLVHIRPALKDVRVFNLNREEAEKLTKEKELKKMFTALATKGNVVMITDGENGAYAHQDGKTYFAGTSPVKAVSRTGAGDAFGSGFVAEFMKTGDVPSALAVGTINAESVIRQIGAKAGIMRKFPTLSQCKRVPIRTISL